MANAAPNEQCQGISPWDASPARRPGPPDFNGIALKNRADAPPNAAQFPTANLLNGEAYMEQGISAVVPNAVISVKFQGGAPVIDYGSTIAGVSNGNLPPIPNSEITIERTPGGAVSGDVFLYWAAGTFPPPAYRPTAALNGTTPGLSPACDWYSTGGNSGVRIVTQDHTATATDLPFTVALG